MEKSNIEELMKLKQLYEQGILTKEEMEAEKTKILSTSTPKVDSLNNEVPPIEEAESSFVSTGEEGKHSRNKKALFGIAAVIVVAIVAVIGFFLNDQTGSEEALIGDIELTKLADEAKHDFHEEVGDFYNQCLSLKELFSVKDDKTSDRLVTLLKKYNYVHKETELDYSGDWKKNISINNSNTSISVSWQQGREYLPYSLNMNCAEDTIVKRWLSELRQMGYQIDFHSTNSDMKQWDFKKNGKYEGSIHFDHNPYGTPPKQYCLLIELGFEELYGSRDEAEKKAAQKEQNDIKELRSQAISIGRVIDAYNNNVGGRADNLYYKQEKLYKCKFMSIKESGGGFKYVLEGYVFGENSNETGEIRLHTDGTELVNLDYPVNIIFRGSLVSINKAEYGHQLYYHFICSEALAYY